MRVPTIFPPSTQLGLELDDTRTPRCLLLLLIFQALLRRQLLNHPLGLNLFPLMLILDGVLDILQRAESVLGLGGAPLSHLSISVHFIALPFFLYRLVAGSYQFLLLSQLLFRWRDEITCHESLLRCVRSICLV